MAFGIFGKKDEDKGKKKPSDSMRKRGGAAGQFADLPDIDIDKLDLDEGSRQDAAAVTASPKKKRPTSTVRRVTSRGTPMGELLIRNGVISQVDLERALVLQEQSNEMLGRVLVNMEVCSEDDIAAALGKQFRVHAVNIKNLKIPVHIAALLGEDDCNRLRVLPFEKLGTTLCVAMANALARSSINEIEEITQLKVKPFGAKWGDIRRCIARVYTEGQLAPEIEPEEAEAVPVEEEMESPAAADEGDVDLSVLDQEAQEVKSNERGLVIDEKREELKKEREKKERKKFDEEFQTWTTQQAEVDLEDFDPSIEGEVDVSHGKTTYQERDGAEMEGPEPFAPVETVSEDDLVAMGYDPSELLTAELVARNVKEYFGSFDMPVPEEFRVEKVEEEPVPAEPIEDAVFAADTADADEEEPLPEMPTIEIGEAAAASAGDGLMFEEGVETVETEAPAEAAAAPAPHFGVWASDDFEDPFEGNWSLTFGEAHIPVAISDSDFEALLDHCDPDSAQEWAEQFCAAGPVQAAPMD